MHLLLSKVCDYFSRYHAIILGQPDSNYLIRNDNMNEKGPKVVENLNPSLSKGKAH
jgi:hypothetical protein